MARRERVRRQPRAQTRHELLDAAARVFARRGFEGATVDAVAEEAGFSTGALYSNFRSKENLFLSLYEERIQRRRRELREAVEQSGGGASGLAAAAASVEEVFGEERDWFLLYFEFSLHAARNAEFAKRFAAVREQGLDELAEGLTHGLKAAGLSSAMDPAELAQAIRALSHGFALDRLVGERGAPDPLLGRVLALLFRGLRADLQGDAQATEGSGS